MKMMIRPDTVLRRLFPLCFFLSISYLVFMLFTTLSLLGFKKIPISDSGEDVDKTSTTELKQSADVRNHTTKSKPSHFVSIFFRGRLGNLMFQFASLYGIAQKNSLRVVIPRDLRIDSVFRLDAERSKLNRDVDMWYYEKKGCTFEPEVMKFGSKKSIYLYGYFQSWKYFAHAEGEIRRQFVFKRDVLRVVAEQIQRLTGHAKRSDFQLVGVHVRRGDMISKKEYVDYGYSVANETFFENAINYYKSKYSKIKFLIVSDDMKWSRKTLKKYKDVVFAEDVNSPEIDMALLANCNHSVITGGSFGWWGAWLAGGNVVYLKDYPRRGSHLASILTLSDYRYPNWIAV